LGGLIAVTSLEGTTSGQLYVDDGESVSLNAALWVEVSHFKSNLLTEMIAVLARKLSAVCVSEGEVQRFKSSCQRHSLGCWIKGS
jgi:hypothetical protein